MAAPTVTIYKNGEPKFPGKKVVVNPRQVRNMDACLDKITREMKLKTAARSLKTPTGGHKIDKLEKIEPGGQYVVCGLEAFKRLNYMEIKPEGMRPTPRKEIEITPVKHSRLQMSGRARKRADAEKGNNMGIFVYKNGDALTSSVKVHLSDRELKSMDKVCDFITNKVHLQTGAVRILYTMDGERVKDPSELSNSAKYVAAGHEKRFKRVAYNDSSILSPRSRVPTKTHFKAKNLSKTTPNRTKPSHGRKNSDRSDRKMSSTTGSIKDGPVHSPRSVPPLDRAEEQPIEEELIDAIESQVLGHRGNAAHANNVFEASGELQERAREIQENKETKEDKPIDLIPAEEVSEEVIEETDDRQDRPEDKDAHTRSREDKDKRERRNSKSSNHSLDWVDHAKAIASDVLS
ncbi:doublecortin domain-containing protein 2 isoform X1 [Nematostella vectensis]|uniref:doublecortin domain-containing protein 2 isoform X1 n=1 Tax=Nematostella vectensis TaxID=45351 RepID=UPI0020774F75|nr:doublecortin domain-containing protein 2 isoform X1 [Nematostella vectensis]